MATSVGNVMASRVLAQQLGVNKAQLAEVLGLPRQSLYRAERERAPRVQARLRDLDEILSYATPWAGSTRRAFAWFRSQPLSSFGHCTAEALVKEGKAAAVKAYLSRVNDGGFA